jgi:mannonate dehydratase
MIRIAVGQSAVLTDEYLMFAAQIGVSGVQLNTPDLPGERYWRAADLIALRERVESFGLKLEAIENIPNSFYDRVILGEQGRDAQAENVSRTIRALGEADVPVLGMNWMSRSVWRTALGPFGRGGSLASRFELDVASDPTRLGDVWVARRDRRGVESKDSWTRGGHLGIGPTAMTEEHMWDNLMWFLSLVLPVAEEAGVTLAFHPDDPPVDSLLGLPHILRDSASLNRLVDAFNSPALAIDLCLGTISERGGEPEVLRAIYTLGRKGRIAYVHARDVQGVLPNFTECFLGEGNYSPRKAIAALSEVGFDGFILDDHSPGMTGDDAYGYRGRAFALGYLMALVQDVNGG